MLYLVLYFKMQVDVTFVDICFLSHPIIQTHFQADPLENIVVTLVLN